MRKIVGAFVLALALLACAPAAAPTAQSNSADALMQNAGKPDIKVWVNTASGVYHCPGTRWYGATKQGEYMTQKEAQDKHYRPAYGRVCE